MSLEVKNIRPCRYVRGFFVWKMVKLTSSCQLPVRFPKELFALSNSSMKETFTGLCWYANHEAAKTPVLIDNPRKQLQPKIDGDFIGLIIRLG